MIAMLVGFPLCWNPECCKMIALVSGLLSMLETLSAVK